MEREKNLRSLSDKASLQKMGWYSAEEVLKKDTQRDLVPSVRVIDGCRDVSW